MIQASVYTDMDGTRYVLAVLDEAERQLIADLQAFAKKEKDWSVYSNFYTKTVGEFYKTRGLSRQQIIQTPVWRIAQDIGGRLQIDSGHARPSDYRGELELVIKNNFGSRREFCQVTGLSEDMLSHVLAGRKNFGIDTLAEALGKIGYALHISRSSEV